MNTDLVYQLEDQNKAITFSMIKLITTLNYIWVIKSNHLQYYTIHAFPKQKLKTVNMLETKKKLKANLDLPIN